MAKRSPLETEVREFILTRSRKFTFSELTDHLKARGRKNPSERDILDILETCALVFSRDFDSFTPRHIFFKRAEFMISPTAEETRAAVLVPGHRFIPFLSPLVRPWECVLQPADKTKVPQRWMEWKVRNLLTYHSLYGQETLSHLLTEDRKENAERIDRDAFLDSTVEVTVYDFSALFREWKFSFGDGLLLRVRDWVQGVYTVEPVKKKIRAELMKESGDWLRRLEKGFSKTFDDLGLSFPLEEQVAYGYFYAGKQALKSPPLHLGGFIDSCRTVHIVDYGVETRLWHESRLDPSALRIPDSVEPMGATGSLDAIFQDMGISLSKVEVEAFMRDELFHRREEMDGVIRRIFAGRPAEFHSPEQLGDFDTYLQKLWERVKRSYNFFADQAAGEARSRILAILERQLEWLRSMDRRRVPLEILPVQEMTGAAQGAGYLVGLLQMLNKKNPGSEAEIRSLVDLLPQIDQTLELLRTKVEAQIEKTLPPGGGDEKQGLRVVRPESRASEPAGRRARRPKSLYVLKIDLMRIRPPIWRRVQAPGSFTLEELHETIQNAMGWDNYHNHSFIIDGRFFSPPSEASMEPDLQEEDESRFTLDELGLEEGKRFRYIYDFGDNWVHQLTVEKILPARNFPEADRTSAICLAGRRACPPEDCGGAPSYQEIVTALKEPLKKKHRELLAWVGDFDPERFDLSAVNLRLRGGKG